MSAIVPNTTESERRDAVLKLMEVIGNRQQLGTRLGSFEFRSSERRGKIVFEGTRAG